MYWLFNSVDKSKSLCVTGSSLTGLKTSWFKNSGRKSFPQLLLVLATTQSIDEIKAPARVLRDRGVRIETVGIGTLFDGVQLKEIATHPAQDHVMAVSKYELLPMIRPLLTVRMCRGEGQYFEYHYFVDYILVPFTLKANFNLSTRVVVSSVVRHTSLSFY